MLSTMTPRLSSNAFARSVSACLPSFRASSPRVHRGKQGGGGLNAAPSAVEKALGLALSTAVLAGCAAAGMPGIDPSGLGEGSVVQGDANQSAADPALTAGTALEGIDPIVSPQLQELAQLAVRTDELGVPDYNRDAFGQAWSDDVEVELGHNGCDTRNDILQRDLNNVTFKPKTRDCVVATGHLTDAYSGVQLDFVRGQGTSELVQIDHVVPLADAWESGAWAWDEELRKQIANDPANLQATTREENQDKKAKTADRWMPSDASYHCTYATRIVHIKATYGLSVTAAEYKSLATTLSGCANPAQ